MRLETLILNANETLPEDGVMAVQVAPFGEFAGVLHLKGGKTREIVQVLDHAAFERILKAWNEAGSPELLVDLDHLSATGGSTRAAAWAGKLRIEDDAGLVADFAFTGEGRRIIDGREYRFVSPVFECSGEGEVLRLESVALTNRPNLPVRCILNQKEFPDSPENPARPENQEPKGTDMEKILSALGLPPDASEDDAAAAIAALKEKVSEAEKAALNAEAEAAADENKDKIANRDEFIKLYTANGKDVAMAFIAALKTSPATPAQTILNDQGGKMPEIANRAEARAALAALPPKERAAFYREHKNEL